jgi:hypothetical protein
MRRMLAVLAIVATFAAGCGGLSGETTISGVSTSSTAGVTTTDAGSTTSGATSSTAGDTGGVDAQVQSLISVTEQLRGLQFLAPVQVTVLSSGDLATRVRAQIAEEIKPDEIVVEEAFTGLIGILDGGVDLAQAIEDLYAEQVGGFYDNDTGELVVAGGQDLSPLAKTIVVHELVHALTDQHFDFAATMDQLVEAGENEQASALQALAEGDATYIQILYLQSLPADEQMRAALESFQADTTVLDSLPEWFGEDLSFPYEWGFGFVDRLVADQGMVGLDQAYELLPATTEQIMHPTAYFALEPGRPVTLPATSLSGYEVYEEGEFGEWNLFLYLLEGVPDADATVAAAGWGGDSYRILWNGSEVAFAYLYEGDTPRDAQEMSGALVDSIISNMAVGAPVTSDSEQSALFEGDDYAFVQRVGSRVMMVASSDPTVGQTLVAAVRPGLTAGN